MGPTQLVMMKDLHANRHTRCGAVSTAARAIPDRRSAASSVVMLQKSLSAGVPLGGASIQLWGIQQLLYTVVVFSRISGDSMPALVRYTQDSLKLQAHAAL